MSESSEYQTHASRLHSRAKQEYMRWVADLTAEQRRNLKRLNIDIPDDSHEVGGHSPLQTSDIADSPLCRVDPSDPSETLAETLADRHGIPLKAATEIAAWHTASAQEALRSHEADLLRIVVGGLLASNNTPIACAGLAFATGMAAASGLGSPAEFARSRGVSRTIISKSMKSWQEQLGLPTSSYQKSEQACATYSEVGKTKHWRKAKVTALALMERLNQLRKS